MLRCRLNAAAEKFQNANDNNVRAAYAETPQNRFRKDSVMVTKQRAKFLSRGYNNIILARMLILSTFTDTPKSHLN